MSTEQYHTGELNSKTLDEEIDANDLEVAMINESFEKQLEQTQLFYNSNLKSIFYGDALLTDETAVNEQNKQNSSPFPMAEIIEEDVKAKLIPLQFLPCISPHSDFVDDAERGKQLDLELDRMMLEEDEKYLFSDSPPLLLSPENHQPISHYNFSSFAFFPSLESQTDQDSSESADAAEAIAIDVIQSLFDDEQSNPTDQESDSDEDMVVSASILQVLQDDETDTFGEEMEDDPIMQEKAMESMITTGDRQQQAQENDITPPLPRNCSFQNFSSPMSTSCLLSTDEQTVPTIDNWEQLAKEPSAAEKMCIEARAMLKRIRAERKATQL